MKKVFHFLLKLRRKLPARLFKGPCGMDCRELVNLLVDYLDEALDPETLKALDRHLADCGPCLAFLNTYKATRNLVREVAAEEMPEELRAKLASFLRETLRRPPGGEG